VDHTAAVDLDDAVVAEYVAGAQTSYRIFYGHTSHGSQIVSGMDMIYAADDRFGYNAGSGTLSLEEREDDLGEYGDLSWADITRDVLNEPGSDINMVMWSWCGGCSDNTEEGINAYLNAMTSSRPIIPAWSSST